MNLPPRSVLCDPAIMAGAPCLAGTRITVYMIQARLQGGDSSEELLQDYPYLDEVSLQIALDHAAQHPG